MDNPIRSGIIPFNYAKSRIPGAPGDHFASLLHRGSVHIKLSMPGTRENHQTPHVQDEIYVILSGHGTFLHDGKSDPVAPGDLMFVAAGTEHRFVDFTPDLAVWVIFFGPDGGEIQA